jgi:hypothetical protein
MFVYGRLVKSVNTVPSKGTVERLSGSSPESPTICAGVCADYFSNVPRFTNNRKHEALHAFYWI